MPDKANIPGPTPTYRNSDAAPFVFFDHAPTFGILGGVIHAELAARTLSPADMGVKAEFITTGHLRCSPAAARSLIDALTKALEMLEQPQPTVTSGSATLN